ncbi:helix-turn-helix domain-containing protein [Corallococcus exiguus]|uniref:helix-turn-helix domain-containing protein n=1 Tax=Corallococcus exiguus TaxID=83462 RepID=UPI00155F9139|nr:helix-turn-helix domain-containing protein [Corallococcus exiguus]
MAQARRSLTLTQAERKGLLRVLRSQTEAGVALRATIVLLSAQGLSAASISRALGVTPRTVHGCPVPTRNSMAASLGASRRARRA